MDSKKMCEFLIKADKYFNGNKVDIKEINKNKSIKSYCHNNDCKTKENGINALIAYLFKEFKKSINNHDYNTTMDSKKMCEFLIKADKYFNGNKVDIKEINKNKSIKSYCHNNDCKTKEN
ncbi:Plasmodium variant antigen protein Cir/Yir/Bir, putative, partial [Plasmodium chabaudi chabaudi]